MFSSNILLNSCALVITLGYVNLIDAAPTSLCSINNNYTNLQLPEIHGTKFYYFGFGSNMLADRIHLQNPSALRIGVGKLFNHRLDFAYTSKRWNGAASTVVPEKNKYVFGTLWDIDVQDMNKIDDQEGVTWGIYEAKTLPVHFLLDDVGDSRFKIKRSIELNARVYLLVEQPKTSISSYTKDTVPEDRQPSKSYLQCLVKGAEESGIPRDYVDWLRSFKHNGRISPYMQHILDLDDVKVYQ